MECSGRNRNYDYAVEAYMGLALMHNTLGRLALDFLIWHSREFNFIRLPSRHSITSSIAPQMHIPYVLEFINATSGKITGCPGNASVLKKPSTTSRQRVVTNSGFAATIPCSH